MDKFEDMVEALEDQEDMVECKECFDLFPKADCIKQEHGYICPTCGRARVISDREIDSTDITTGLYDQEFPDVAEYAPGTTKDWEKEATVIDALDALLADEVEAIDGYEEAEEVIEASDREDKKEILDTIEHIKEEEEEHIDELKDHCPECEVPEEVDLEKEEEVDEALSLGGGIAAAGAAIGAGMIGSKLLDSKETEEGSEGSEDLDELLDANVNLAVDGGEGNDVSVLSSHEPEKKGEEELNELLDANVNLSVDGGENNVVDVLSPLNASHDECKGEECLTESKVSQIYIASSLESGEIVAACYADSEEEARVKLEQAFVERTGLTGGELEDCVIELANEFDLEILTDEDFVKESLSEQMLTEAPFNKDKVDITTKLFKQGFILRILDVEARTGDKTAYKTYADAEKAAKAAAKRFPNAQVYVLAKPVSDLEAAEKAMLDDFIKSSEFPMFKDKQWVLLGYKGGKATLDYMSSMQKKFAATLKNQKKLDKALGKATTDDEETIPGLEDDTLETVDTEETSDETKPEDADTEPAVTEPAGSTNKEKNKQIKVALLKALVASGVAEAEAKATVLKIKDNIMFQLRKDLLGESLEEDLRTTEEATTELKDTESVLKDAALGLKNMASAMKEDIVKPEE